MPTRDTRDTRTTNHNDGVVAFVYLITVVGAAAHFVQQSSGALGFIMALLQALVWPAYATYEALRLLGI